MIVTMSAQPTPTAGARVPVFVAARHNGVRNALWALLEMEPGIEPLAAIGDLADLTRLLARVAPPVVVVDEAILGRDGISWLPGLVATAPATAFVVVGLEDHPLYVTRAREAGAVDYVRLEDAERLRRVVLLAPLTAGRRRTGRRAVTVVPAPGTDSTTSVPSSSATRSRMPTRPKPSEASDGSKP
jgi:chemotaxis response regulator CheB